LPIHRPPNLREGGPLDLLNLAAITFAVRGDLLAGQFLPAIQGVRGGDTKILTKKATRKDRHISNVKERAQVLRGVNGGRKVRRVAVQ
jgi:hypothetical protein